MIRLIAPILVGAALLASASVLAPPRAKLSRSNELVLPPGAARVIALGRDVAAADVAWLYFVQLIGDAQAELEGWPNLEKWTLLQNDLAPRFDMPYWTSAILLGSARRPEAAKAITERAQEALDPAWCRREDLCETPKVLELGAYMEAHCKPCEYLKPCEPDIERWPGYVEYFGVGDGAAAAEHFCQARRRGGPYYLERLAVRLATQARNCETLSQDLANTLRGGERRSVLGDRASEIIEQCVLDEIERAASAFRLSVRRDPASVDELVHEGFVQQALIRLPGRCYALEKRRAVVKDCP